MLTLRSVVIAAEAAARVAGLRMPEARRRVDVAELAARRAVDLEIVILVHGEVGVETYAFVDQAAMKQQRACRRAAVEEQLHMIARVAGVAQRAALRIDDARARKHDAFVQCARRREQDGEMVRQ